jgi:LPS-assembly lipoprotein
MVALQTRRRALGRCALALTSGFALGSCGFALRQAPALRFRSIALMGFEPQSQLAIELRRQMSLSRTTQVVVDAPAEVWLQALSEQRDTQVAATTVNGEVRELRLNAALRFTVREAKGRVLIAPTEISQTRDLSYTENTALAKEQEEAALYRAMEGDIAAQVMRRLSAGF